MKFLVIQTAFLGDAILATSILESIHRSLPEASIHILVRKGHEDLFKEHPFLGQTLVFDKSRRWRSLLELNSRIKKEKYDAVINLHRFGSSGLLAWRSGAPVRIGFDKNPFSFGFTHKIHHDIGNSIHETERNHRLLNTYRSFPPAKPRLYPSPEDVRTVANYKESPYLCIAPASVWFTKQWPAEKWVELIRQKKDRKIYLLGSSNDDLLCDHIIKSSGHTQIISLAGKLSFLQTAALMKDAEMNYVNDSAPMHIASAMNAPVTAIFCSTTPAFGFGPLSDDQRIVETREPLACRPCGIHGKKTCPQGHFKCALTIPVHEL